MIAWRPARAEARGDGEWQFKESKFRMDGLD